MTDFENRLSEALEAPQDNDEFGTHQTYYVEIYSQYPTRLNSTGTGSSAIVAIDDAIANTIGAVGPFSIYLDLGSKNINAQSDTLDGLYDALCNLKETYGIEL